MNRRCRRTIGPALSAGVATVGLLAAAPIQQAPVFRGGVDLVGIEVVVLDKSGTPVPTLTAADFTVVAGGRPRRVVAADFVAAGLPLRSAAAARAPIGSSNLRVVASRSILLVVDVEQIPAGGGRLVMKSIGASLDRLAPGDRVGLMTLADARIALTTDRASVRRALDGIVGSSVRMRDRDMTFGEATRVAARDRRALQAYWTRIVDQGYSRPNNPICAPPRGFDTLRDVTPECVAVAEAALERARSETNRVLDRLRAIAMAFGAYSGPKAIVFVSGGLLNDTHTRGRLQELAAEADRARLSVHSILVEAEGGIGGRSSVETSQFDRQIALAGLTELAGAARGSVQVVAGDASEALALIDRQLSGRYVVSFERLAEDRDGVRQDLEVRSTRPNLTVLAGRGVTPARAAPGEDRVPADAKTSVADLLKSSTAVGAVAIDVDAYALPATSADGDARAIVVVEIEREASGVAAFGFQIAEHSGRVIADGYDGPANMQAAGPARSLFITTVPIGDGRYVGRFAVIDRDGRRGSVEHTFDAPAGLGNAVAASDIIFGDRSTREFQPVARVPAGARTLPVRLVVRDTSRRFEGIAVRATVTHARDDARVSTTDVPLIVTPDPVRRFADSDLRIDVLPPAEYVVTMTVAAGGVEIARRQRIFRR